VVSAGSVTVVEGFVESKLAVQPPSPYSSHDPEPRFVALGRLAEHEIALAALRGCEERDSPDFPRARAIHSF